MGEERLITSMFQINTKKQKGRIGTWYATLMNNWFKCLVANKPYNHLILTN
jgi:hypothetical protein